LVKFRCRLPQTHRSAPCSMSATTDVQLFDLSHIIVDLAGLFGDQIAFFPALRETAGLAYRAEPGLPTAGSTGRAAAPGEKTVVFEAGLAVGEGGAGQGLDAAAGGFENGLSGRRVPLHRCAKARVEIGFSGGDDAKLQRTAAALALAHRIVGEELGEAPAVFVRAAVDDNEPVRWHACLDRLGSAAVAAAGRSARPARGVGQTDSRPVHDPEHRPAVLDKCNQYCE